jgi:hypothetical protein
VPAEEARGDTSMKDISFHVYEYIVSKQADDNVRRQLELVQKRMERGELHCFYYLPALGHRQYHATSYMLAAQCRREQCAIERGSFSSHHDYGERMPLSFNKEIHRRYYQKNSVSVKGSLLEWIDKGDERHTQYFGHWSNILKQDVAATMQNMCAELCMNDNTTQLVDELSCNRTVWKGADGAAVSYCCGKSIYGQGILQSIVPFMVTSTSVLIHRKVL